MPNPTTAEIAETLRDIGVGRIALAWYHSRIMLSAADRLEELERENAALKRQSRWISVDERMPTADDADALGYVLTIREPHLSEDDLVVIMSWRTVCEHVECFAYWRPFPKAPMRKSPKEVER